MYVKSTVLIIYLVTIIFISRTNYAQVTNVDKQDAVFDIQRDSSSTVKEPVAEKETAVTITNILTVTNSASKHPPKKISQYEKVNTNLQQLINSATEEIVTREPVKAQHELLYAPGRLEILEKKAFECNALKQNLNKKEDTIAQMVNGMQKAQAFIQSQQRTINNLQETTNSLSAQVSELQKELNKLKESLKVLQMGKYEYYEVKEGDTCKSIAADPSIYNDESKEQYIRQANYENVKDLDNLVPGQVLIIPRFPASSRYEF
jgi:DNA repair exonuclease SbcCD ATPase subunit